MVGFELVEHGENHVLLRLKGELSGEYWTDVLAEALEEHYIDDGVSVIHVDLSPITFLDNFGVATLVALHRRSRERGKRFLVQNPGGQVREKLEVTGVAKVLQAED